MVKVDKVKLALHIKVFNIVLCINILIPYSFDK